jgi:hypothetical protein
VDINKYEYAWCCAIVVIESKCGDELYLWLARCATALGDLRYGK